jgi:phosphorylcholine metabolism protein LicD
MTNKKEEYHKYHMSDDNRQTLYKVLQDVTRIFDRDHIKYFADGGTLLGCYRHQDAVPHDDDADLWVDQTDYIHKLPYLYEEFMDLGYQIQFLPNIVKIGRIGADKSKNVVVDLFPYRLNGGRVEMADDKHRQWWPQCYHEITDCFPLQKMKYGPLEIYCPKDGTKYLDRYYPSWRNTIIIDNSEMAHRAQGDPCKYIVFNVSEVL